jgi:methylenetetrahydrofolate reductase (NADPH)
MRIDDILASADEPVFSFEFFPPKTEEGERNLYAALEELGPLAPDFVSVTWGAGGSTRSKTIEIVKRLKSDYGLEAMAHFTCVGATRDDLRVALEQIHAARIDNVLTLRGDPPAGEDHFVPTDGGLAFASELAELVTESYPDFCLVGACYPEVHQEAPDLETDLDNLQRKVDAGVRVLITQLFFDNRDYFRFVAAARERGITAPIIPGIMPVLSTGQIKRMTSMCGATIPPALLDQIEPHAEDPETVSQYGMAYATLQAAELLAGGAPGVHFYTINRSPATRAILSALRTLRPWNRPGAGPAAPVGAAAGG